MAVCGDLRGMVREYTAGNSRGLGWREFAGTFGCAVGSSVVPSGREWNGSQSGQGTTELGFRASSGEDAG